MVARLAQLSQTDIEKAILEEIEKNPLLELEEPASEDMSAPEPPQEAPLPGDEEWEEDIHLPAHFSSGMDIPDFPIPDEPDFFDRLLMQVRQSGMDDDEILIAEEIIGSLDENGFLSGIPLMNIAYKLSVPLDKAEQVLRKVQRLGPPGIAARSLQECMLLQLHALHEEPFVTEIVEREFEAFMAGDDAGIAARNHLSEEDMRYAREQIAKLNPKPAGGHADYMKRSIIPDVILREKNGMYYVALNDTGTPAVRLSETYLAMLENSGLDKQARTYLNGNRQAALWFMQALEHRKQSLIAIAQSIVHRQHDFLSGKRDHPAPMIMKTIAEDTDLDISTVSRIVNGKYLQTPSGVYELKYFFSEKAERSDGLRSSTRDLERDLRGILDAEDASDPLSDEQLRDALTDMGYRVARRTVAKYREKLGIPGSHARRKP